MSCDSQMQTTKFQIICAFAQSDLSVDCLQTPGKVPVEYPSNKMERSLVLFFNSSLFQSALFLISFATYECFVTF